MLGASNYRHNLKLWRQGWRRFHEITEWKPTWGPDKLKWWALYLFDYGACTLILGGQVVSVSWYVGQYWGIEGHHFANAGRPLWESVRSPPWIRVLAPVVWLPTIAAAIWTLWRLWRHVHG